MRYAGILAAAMLLLSCRTYPEENICFGEHIAPLIKDDCATCHGNGEYGVRLRGSDSDYQALLAYVTPFELEHYLEVM